MLEILKCPACSASLEAPKDGSRLLRCPYCNMLISQGDSPADALAQRLRNGVPFPTAGPALKAGGIVTVMGIVATIIAIPLVISLLSRPPVKQAPRAAPVVVMPAIPKIIVPSVPAKPTPPPAFARMAQEFGVEGVGPGRFQEAQSVALDGLGHIFIGEISGGRIQVFDLQGKYLNGWNTGSVKHLLALAADRKGIVYADVAPQILRFEAMTGKSLGPVDDMNTDVEEFYRDVFCTVDGDLYAIGGNSHIIQFDAQGKIKNTIRANDKAGEALQLERVLVQPTGEIYALDHDRGILKFASDGHYINRFGSGQGKGHLDSPCSLATDSKRRIYVSDSDPSIRVFDGDGGFIDAFGPHESAFGLAISDSNDIYACFATRHVVRKYALEKP
jgi:hypothetical protein